MLPVGTFQTPVGMEEFSSSFFVSSVLYSNLLSVRSTFPASFSELFFAFSLLFFSILIAKEDYSGDGEPLRWLHFLVLFFSEDEC